MTEAFHYPPELFELLIETIARLSRAKKGVVLFFRGAGVSDEDLADVERTVATNPDSINKFEIVRKVLTKVNSRGDSGLRSRREIIKRVKAIPILEIAEKLNIQVRGNKAMCFAGHDKRTPTRFYRSLRRLVCDEGPISGKVLEIGRFDLERKQKQAARRRPFRLQRTAHLILLASALSNSIFSHENAVYFSPFGKVTSQGLRPKWP